MIEKLNQVIDSTITEYNKEAGYDFIFTNTGKDNLLFGNEQYNITSEILEILNSDLIWCENLPLFNDGLFINVNKKLTSDEESIKFGFDIYSIDAFKQFRTK